MCRNSAFRLCRRQEIEFNQNLFFGLYKPPYPAKLVEPAFQALINLFFVVIVTRYHDNTRLFVITHTVFPSCKKRALCPLISCSPFYRPTQNRKINELLPFQVHKPHIDSGSHLPQMLCAKAADADFSAYEVVTDPNTLPEVP